jgi:hypothetical protein
VLPIATAPEPDPVEDTPKAKEKSPLAMEE